MNYALIEHGVVTNVVVGPLPADAEGVALDGLDVKIGDEYEGGLFYREGQRILSISDQLAELKRLALEQDAALVELAALLMEGGGE